MITLYQPQVEDLWFKEQMLQDKQTMSYNRAYGGTLPFPREKWDDWHTKWVSIGNKDRFYRYIEEDGHFYGEAAYHFDADRQIYLADVLIHAPCRRKGYGREGLRLLCEAAKANGIETLFDDIAIDNPSLTLFLQCGFCEVLQTDKSVLVKKDLNL